ncbi:5-methylaminomethyl-2-thiouridylate-methyltransferase [Dendrothele bispora CBS 962.96]|uniref:tRNA-5-taurinomethyluridine 2-sulfurtransferase n=1 Tax=Dendrothele bispora (strain CBS 962.96) TaxID=1314807 RepID=A0A4S8LE56_DENBC|nr:5-methylaminomethyl-2-thiouridylate-methyltransferase [Dendrothele bispora CBS 962.96]
MSGGVDSSVAARLLADKDYDLSAVFMRNWDTRDESGTDIGCEWEKDWQDVQQVCKSLGIPCRMIDLSRQYWNRIFEPALRIWESGETPNPDVWCNREIKFGALLEHLPMDSRSGQRSWFATGHYARKDWSLDGRPKLLTAKDELKDQSFYLSSISETGLARALFPLGSLTKVEVRKLARQYHIETAERPESMGLCFVGERGKFSDFLSSYIPFNPGPIIDLTTGTEIATHQGLWGYTIGQKARIPGMLQKMFVARKEHLSNTVYVVPGGNHEALYMDVVNSRDWAWIWRDSPPQEVFSDSGLRALVKVRHRAKNTPCTVHQDPNGHVTITIDEPQKGVSPGQVAAIWRDDWCLGCGTITTTDQSWHNNLKKDI